MKGTRETDVTQELAEAQIEKYTMNFFLRQIYEELLDSFMKDSDRM
jgi:hypothetical protein